MCYHTVGPICRLKQPNLPSATRPQPHSAEIPVPAFITLSFLEVHYYGYEMYHNSDTDFITEDDSVRNGFNQYYLARDMGLSRKGPEQLISAVV